MNINSVTISGNLTRDSEVRYTVGGTPILGFPVAVNERHKNAQDEWEDYPNFFNCTKFFGGNQQSADWWAQRLTKGTHVTISGHLHYSSWEKDGQKRSAVEIIVEAIDAPTTANRQQQPQQGQPQQYQQPNYNAPARPQPPQQDFYDEDMPF